MDALEAITGRRVQRAFDRRRVDPKAIRKIVDAGRHAMSARNLQPWRFVVVESRERLSAIGALSSTGRFVADERTAESQVFELRLRERPSVKFCGECREATLGGLEARPASRPSRLYPQYLAEKILTSRSALEGERKQLTVLFADVKAP